MIPHYILHGFALTLCIVFFRLAFEVSLDLTKSRPFFKMSADSYVDSPISARGLFPTVLAS